MPWWKAFHAAVDHSNADAEYMLTLLGQPAYIIEVGMMGLDCAHDCSSEIHPTYALAVHVKNEPSDDEWAIFAWNWGDEGYCAVGQIVDSDLTTVYLTLPWYPGATDTAPVVLTDKSVWKKNGDATQVTTFPQFTQFGSVRRGTGFVVELDLGPAYAGPLVHGELHLQWDMQTVTTSGSARAATIKSFPGQGRLEYLERQFPNRNLKRHSPSMWLGCRQIHNAKSKQLWFIRIRVRLGLILVQPTSVKRRLVFKRIRPGIPLQVKAL
jgi:hypothetical protein